MLIAIFIAALATAMLLIFYKMYLESRVENKTYLMIVFSFFFYAVAITIIYKYIIHSRKIIVDKEKIQLGDKLLFWKDMKNCELGGKKSFGFVGPLEVATLKFSDKSQHYIFDDIYANGWEIKSFINNVIIQKKEYAVYHQKPISDRELQNEIFYKYAGNPIFSFRGLMMWPLIIFILYLTFSSGGKMSLSQKIFVLVPICIFWFLMNAYSTDYFEVSKNFLVVKNHYFFWKKKIFRLDNIEELVFETQPKQANMLRIITKDFKRKLYRGGTLKDSTWLELKDDVERKNIKVRNECI